MSNPIVKTLFKHKDDYYKKKENGSYNKIIEPLIKNNSRNLYSINGLPQKYRVKNLNNENEYCSICLDVFLKEEYPSVVSLNCGHAFHKICIEGAFKTKKECPVCRAHMSDPKNIQNILGRNLNKPLKNIVYQPIMTFAGYPGMVKSVAYCHDGLRMATASWHDNSMTVLDVMSRAIMTTLKEHSMGVTSVAFSPDGKHVVSGSYDHTMKVWRILQVWDDYRGVCVATLKGHSSSVRSIAYRYDGKYIVSGSDDNTIKIWKFKKRWHGLSRYWKCIKTLEGHSDSVSSVAYSPNGQCIASGSHDKSVKVWDVGANSANYGSCVATLEGHSSWVMSVAYSPDGQCIASGSEDKSVKVWGAKSGAITATLNGHSDFVYSVAYSPDGKYIASGSRDTSLRVWDATSGSCVATLEGHSSMVRSVAYSPDGQCIASGSDSTVKVWDVSNLLVQDGGKKNIIKKKKSKKLIDTYKKSDLVKIAKMNDVSLKMRNDKVKTKLQLFNSLKRKKLI